MTTFYPYQWDLNYRNPRVFNEMIYNFLYLTNQGIDIVRIDAVPYIWKELGTTCRNLKTGVYNCPYDAHDSRNCMPGCFASGRGCNGTRKSCAVFWNG